MGIGVIDHTAIAVADMDEALDRYQRLLGKTVTERDAVPDQRVEVAFLQSEGSKLELICPTDNDSGVARFLANHGEGLHHLAVRVDDIEAELDRLEREGVELIDRRPRPGLHGLIAFVHPRGTGGILLELVQHAEN